MMKKSAVCYTILILLFLWCSGCSRDMSPQSEKYVETLDIPTSNADEWIAYQSILSGDFTVIYGDENDYYRTEMQYMYDMYSKNGQCEWEYILIDFNGDGIDELFIKLTSSFDSALFTYADGSARGISIDNVEVPCYIQPLKDGRLLETYNQWIAPTKTIYNLDSNFNPVNQKQYFSILVDNDYKEIYDDIIAKYPTITGEGLYYFQRIEGKITELSEKDWEQIQNGLNELIVPDIEWQNYAKINEN